MSEPDLHRGARIGSRIAQLVGQTIVWTHNKLLDTKHKLAVMVFNTISNEVSDEVHDTIGHLFRRMASEVPDDSELKPMLDFMGHGRGQLKAISGSSVMSGSILWALGTMISNELAPITYAYMNEDPHMAPDSGTAAQMAAVGAVGEGEARYAMGANGHGARWQDGFLEIARSYPAASDLLDLVRRNIISPGEFASLAKKSGTPDNVAAILLASINIPLSYQDVALSYLRGEVSEGAYFESAKMNGVSASDASIYLQSIGEPPGTMDMMEAFRRGFIDQGTLQKGIKQSRVRDEWIPMIEQLRYSPMSTADAVNAAVQGHITQGQMADLAQQNGLEPGHVDTLYQTAGSPLSRTELNDLYNRGEIGSDVVTQGLRESRLKDKYVQDAFALRQRLLEPRSLGEAVVNGAMTHDVAITKAMQNGFSAQDAAFLVGSAANRKMQSYRDRLIVQIEDMFSEGGMTHEAALDQIKSLGHTDDEANMILRAADFKREQRVFNTAVNVVRSKLVGHHIDKNQASALLDGMGVIASQRDFFLGFWEIEAAANVRTLTEAQTIKAVKTQTITPDQGAERLIALGYSSDDAILLLEMM